jgi:hypothetical protein
MANFVYTEAKRAWAAGEIDWDAHTIKAVLVMTNSTADTEEDKLLMNAFTTLDEYDGSSYARVSLASKAVASDTGNNRAELDCADFTFSGIGAGTRLIEGLLIYKHVSADSDSIPLAWIDNFSNFNGNGGDATFVVGGDGLVQFT